MMPYNAFRMLDNRKNNRLRAYRRGILGEYGAIAYLTLRGWRLVERRFKCNAGEIDLIARKGRQLAIVEVKTRGDERAEEVLSPQQRRRISRAAAIYLAKHPEFASFFVRFDVIVVLPWQRLRHIPNAWEVDTP